MFESKINSKTERKELRAKVRSKLGPNSDVAPQALTTILAVEYLDELLKRATNGRFKLRVVDMAWEDSLIPPFTARQRVLTEGVERDA